MRIMSYALFGVLLSFLPAANATVVCSGKVSNLAISPQGGTVTVALTGTGNWYICNLSTVQDGVAIDTCKAIYAQLSAAVATGKQVAFYYSDGSSTWTYNTSYCMSVGNWAVPNPYPYYFTIMDY